MNISRFEKVNIATELARRRRKLLASSILIIGVHNVESQDICIKCQPPDPILDYVATSMGGFYVTAK